MIKQDQDSHGRTWLHLTTEINDGYGRATGGWAYVVAHEDGYRVEFQATRDGKSYGALNRSLYAASFEAGLTLATSKLTAMRKRIERVAAKHGGVYRTAGDLARNG